MTITVTEGDDVRVDDSATFHCDELIIGAGTIVRKGAEIYGTKVVLGRESFIDEYAVIGGGSAGELVTGDWFHLGMFAQVNTARPVTVGDEVGIGIGSRIFTHGAYLSEWDGFPVDFAAVTVGSRVWLPNAMVLPGCTIGDDVVVGAGSLVTRNLPSNCFAVGTPARVVDHKWCAPNPEVRSELVRRIRDEAEVEAVVDTEGSGIACGSTWFDIAGRTVEGPVTPESERLRNQLRRHGIRFPVWARENYEAWT